MPQPLVSIIIPLFNQGEYIREAIESVLNQTYDNWEIIVADDGSTDNGGQIVEELALEDCRISYFRQVNSGPSIARNECISRSRGKYILPLDGDDKIADTYIEKAVEYLEQNDDCKLVYCDAEKFGAETGSWLLPDYKYEDILWNNMIFCTAMFRRADFDRTSGYNKNMVWGLEDWDFWLSLLSRDDKVYKIDEVLFYYRIKSKSRSTQLSPRYNEATRQIYKNHQDLYENYTENIIQVHNKIRDNESLIRVVLNSRTYKVGRMLTAPYRFFHKKRH